MFDSIRRMDERVSNSWYTVAFVFVRLCLFCLFNSEVIFGVKLFEWGYQREDRLLSEAGEKCITDWLDEQRRGGTGFAYWSNSTPHDPVRLYSVQSWEIVSMESDRFGAEANVLISSSTKLGTPIRKTWKITSRDYVDGTFDGTFGLYEVQDLSE